MTLGEKIRQTRKLQKMTMRDFAEKLGISFTYIGQVERGERNLSVAKMEEWGKVLGVDLVKEASSLEIERATLDLFKDKDKEEIRITEQGTIENILTLLNRDTDNFSDIEVMELWFKVKATIEFELYKMKK